MLIGRERNYSFDDDEYIFELLLDGGRAFAFLSSEGLVVTNRKGIAVTAMFPELHGINGQVANKCVLDGEIVVMDGKTPDHEEYQRRLSLQDPIARDLAARRRPATFVAHDVVYCRDRETTQMPLWERKDLLQDLVRESEGLSVARYVAKRGGVLFNAAGERGFGGVVGKGMDSRYVFGALSRDWIAVRHQLSDEFVICGHVGTSANMAGLILGQYDATGVMLYRGQASIIRDRKDYFSVTASPQAVSHPFPQPPPVSAGMARWLIPCLVCTVSFVSRSERGVMRQPVFKTLRWDLAPEDAVIRGAGARGERNLLDMPEWRTPPAGAGGERLPEA